MHFGAAQSAAAAGSSLWARRPRRRRRSGTSSATSPIFPRPGKSCYLIAAGITGRALSTSWVSVRRRNIQSFSVRARSSSTCCSVRHHADQVLVFGKRHRTGAPIHGPRRRSPRRWKLSEMDLQSRRAGWITPKPRTKCFGTLTSSSRGGSRWRRMISGAPAELRRPSAEHDSVQGCDAAALGVAAAPEQGEYKRPPKSDQHIVPDVPL